MIRHHNNNHHPAPDLPGTVPDILPPHNVEAERGLLGSILLDNWRLDEIAQIELNAGDFYIIRHGWLFEIMQGLYNNGQRADQITVLDELIKLKLVDESEPLGLFLNDTPTSAHALYYAKIVKSHSKRRKALEWAGELARLAHDQTNDFDTELAENLEKLEKLTTEGESKGWEIFTLNDAYKERPPLSWVVNGVLSLPSLSILYGAPGTMKSLLLGDMLADVSTGSTWLNPLPGQSCKPFQTVSSPVLWVDFDNGKRRTHERFEAFGRVRNLPADTPLYYASMPSPWLDVSKPAEVDRLANLVNRLGAKLVALDNLGTISGGVDENSPDMIPVMSNLRQLAENTEAAIVVIHHQRKSNGFKSRAGETLRGHSCIEAALDLALLVERKEDSDRVTVKSTKTRDTDVMPFSAQFGYEHKPGTFELAEARFFGLPVEKDEKQETLQLIVLSCVKMSPGLSQTKLREAVKAKLPDASNHAIRAEILAMVETKQLKEVSAGNGKPSSYYQNFDEIDF